MKRKLFVKYELKKILLKSVICNSYVSPLVRYYALYKLNHLPKYKMMSKQVTRCVATGRVYNILKNFKYSRFYLRSEIAKGSVVG